MRIVSSIILIFPFCVFSQSEPVLHIDLHYMAQGIVIESLGNIGGKSTNSIITEIGASNPASIYDYAKKSLGVSYQYDTKIDEAWNNGIGHGRNFNFIPQSVGIVFPIDDWRFGIAMNQMYNTEIDYGKLEPTMVWPNPQGYIHSEESIQPERREQVLRNSLTVAYKIEDIFESNNSLNLGFQVNYNYLIFEQSLLKNDKIEESSNSINFVPGIIYEFLDYNKMNSRIGLYYESKIEMDEEFSYNSYPVRLISNFPHKLHLGVYHPCGEHWRYSANISYLFWNDINENFENQMELSANAGYLFSKDFQINFGFFSTDKKYINNDSGFNLNNLNAIYLILSADYKIGKFELDFTVADSRLMSDEWRRQTIFKLGSGLTF